MLVNNESKKRRSVNQIRQYLRHKEYGAMKEFNAFDPNTPMYKQIRNAERRKILRDIAKYVGGLKGWGYKTCCLHGCNTKMFDLGSVRKYCSNACRQKAYRLRKRLSSV